jgi:hypothetical protein
MVPLMTVSKRFRLRNIIVVELDATMSRRIPSLPHLYVANTVDTPESRFRQLQNGKGPEYARGRHLALRQDLNPFTDAANDELEAARRLEGLKRALTKDGYALNGISTTWHAYVVDLDPTGMTDVGKGYVYVGQTSHMPEERYAIHKAPRRPAPAKDIRSKVVHKRGVGLNYELMKQLTPLSPVFTQQDALALEKKWAKRLHNMGYRVEAGDATPGRDSTSKPQ